MINYIIQKDKRWISKTNTNELSQYKIYISYSLYKYLFYVGIIYYIIYVRSRYVRYIGTQYRHMPSRVFPRRTESKDVELRKTYEKIKSLMRIEMSTSEILYV